MGEYLGLSRSSPLFDAENCQRLPYKHTTLFGCKDFSKVILMPAYLEGLQMVNWNGREHLVNESLLNYLPNNLESQ